jgi:hypothetical protein
VTPQWQSRLRLPQKVAIRLLRKVAVCPAGWGEGAPDRGVLLRHELSVELVVLATLSMGDMAASVSDAASRVLSGRSR